jgi:hypothetical protein
MARLFLAASIDVPLRRPFVFRKRRPRQSLWAATLVGAALSGGRDDVGFISRFAEVQMTRGAITHYRLGAQTHTLDIKIHPTTPLPTGEAGVTGRKICALGTQGLAAKLTHLWTVRVFIDFAAAEVFSCDIAPTLAAPPRPRRQ